METNDTRFAGSDDRQRERAAGKSATALSSVPEIPSEPILPSPSPMQVSLYRFRHDKRALVSLSVILFFVVLALVGPPIYQRIGAPYNSSLEGVLSPALYHGPFHQVLENQDQFISAQNWLGTDEIGRDLLARLMQGVLVSLSVALLVQTVTVMLGVTIGVLAGYYGGWLDQVLARFTDLIFAFPNLLFVILLSSIFGPWADTHLKTIPLIGPNGNARLVIISLALSFTAWPLLARFVRGQTLQIRELPFVEAARASGTRNFRIIRRHIIPNLFSILVVTVTLNLGGTIIGEAGISLLGLGVQPPGSSLGLMIVEGINTIDAHPWEALLPSLVLTMIVLSFSFLGDALRDALDPH